MPIPMMLELLLTAIKGLSLSSAMLSAVAPSAPPADLARGLDVRFCPAPAGTGPAGVEAKSRLTDGVVSARKDGWIWLDKGSVVWEFQPRITMRIDLGSPRMVGEVAARFVGGSQQPGVDFPVFVRLFTSTDGESWELIDSYDSHREGDDARFEVPEVTGKAWVHKLSFRDLGLQARYVVLEVGGTGTTAIDEIFVTEDARRVQQPRTATDPMPRSDPSDGHGPRVTGLRVRATPISGTWAMYPLLLLDESSEKKRVRMSLRLPAGVVLGGLEIERNPIMPISRVVRPNGGSEWVYECNLDGRSKLPWALVWLRSEGLPPGNETGVDITLETQKEKTESTILLRSIVWPDVPRCERLLISLGWWRFRRTTTWPDAAQSMAAVGLNMVSTMEGEIPPADETALAELSKFRSRGFRLMHIETPFNRMMDNLPLDGELCCITAEGKPLSTQMCPSYRGRRFEQELQRIAINVALLRPDMLVADIELWDWRGPYASADCARCQASRARSGVGDLGLWKQRMGSELWNALYDRVQRAALATSGKSLPIGSFDFRPGAVYQDVWPYDEMAARGQIAGPQPCFYGPLSPYQLKATGDLARHDRLLTTATQGLMWLSPGDSGIVDAERLRCAILESLFGGSIGVLFWSDRYWDGESLLGVAQAVRAAKAAENTIADGKPSMAVKAASDARVLALETPNEIVALVADYAGSLGNRVDVMITVPWPANVVEAESAREICRLGSGTNKVTVELGGHRSAVLVVRRASDQ